jgi:hypothetical protein
VGQSLSDIGRGYLSVPSFSGAKNTDPNGDNLRGPDGKMHGGRPPGTKSRNTSEARAFALEIVRSPAYRKSLLDRVQAGTLASNIEAMLWAYAYGKPADRLEITHPAPSAQLAEMSVAELADRAELISKVLREVGDVDAAELAMKMVDDAARARENAPIDVTPVKSEPLQRFGGAGREATGQEPTQREPEEEEQTA